MRNQVEVGKRIAAIRTLNRQTQRSFSDSLGASLRAIQNYEKGDRKLPADLLMKICRKYDVDPFWVMHGPGGAPCKAIPGLIDFDVLLKAERLIGKLDAITEHQLGSAVKLQLLAEAYNELIAHPKMGLDMVVT